MRPFQLGVCGLIVGLLLGGVAPTWSEEAAQTRARVRELLGRLGHEQFDIREKATEDLKAMGPRIASLLAPQVNHPDLETAIRVQQVLRCLRGSPGPEVEGLMLAAVLAGPKPRKGEVVPLWLTITNTAAEDRYVFRYMWRLYIQPEHPRTITRVVGASTPATLGVRDFHRVRPGESLCVQMDAEIEDEAEFSPLKLAHLEISLPHDERHQIPAVAFTGQSELTSGPIELTFSDEAKAPDEAALRWLADLGELKEAGGEPALAQSPAYEAGAKLGFRRNDEHLRWRVFEFVCQHPRPALADDLIAFLAGFGPRIRDEDRQQRLLIEFARALPEERRWVFYQRVALAIQYDWRSLEGLFSFFSGLSAPAERVAAARMAQRLIEMGVPMDKAKQFLALELLSSPDAAFRDLKKAGALIEEQLKESPNDPLLQFAHAYAQGDQAAMEKARKAARSNDERNNMAWDIVARFPVGALPAEWPAELSRPVLTSVEETDRQFPYFADTYAATCAYQCDYVKALEWQEKSLSRLAQDDAERPGIGERVAYYYALMVAQPDERPRLALEMPPVKSKAVRDALLKRLGTEQDRSVRSALVRMLQERYASDHEVDQVLKGLQAGNK
jgi:hypothetical protein